MVGSELIPVIDTSLKDRRGIKEITIIHDLFYLAFLFSVSGDYKTFSHKSKIKVQVQYLYSAPLLLQSVVCGNIGHLFSHGIIFYPKGDTGDHKNVFGDTVPAAE